MRGWWPAALGAALLLGACAAGASPSPPVAVAPGPGEALRVSEPTTTVVATTVATTTVVPTTVPEPALGCAEAGRSAVVDRARQRAWLCDGPWRVGPEIAVTTAVSQPLPGAYQVYGKDRVTTSRFGRGLSYLDDFVAFSKGRFTGARIAFHAVPRTAAGEYLQPFDTLGDLDRQGESAGCIRARPDDARRIWDWLSLGDPVVVIS